MPEDKTLFEKLDDISAGQSEVLKEISGVKTQIGSTDDRVAELEKEIYSLKNQQSYNQLSDRDILRQFLKQSRKSWRWFGNRKQFKNHKYLTIASLILFLVLGLISTIVTSICFGYYSAFTLFENIWLVFGIIYLVHAFKAKQLYEVHALAENCSIKYVEDELGMMFPRKERPIFRVFKWLAVIAIVVNIILIFALGHKVQIAAFIIELLFLGAILLSTFINFSFFAKYSIIYVHGQNLVTKEKVVVVLPPGAKDLMLEEELKMKMPQLFL